ncbi:MAG TPA: sugar transferase [Anaerolineae bacterium]|nr:sugar transferase [Anaerolineae bacterium]
MTTVDRASLHLVRERCLLGSLSPHSGDLYFWLKRLIDVSLAFALLMLLSPLMLLIGVLVKVDSRGSALFKQERMGFNWRKRKPRPFLMYKFRSMYQDCDDACHRDYVRRWINGGLDGEEGTAKLAGDRRVTRVGRILRKTSLDELPQLWNVLKGDMSLVGPRPVPLYEVAEYEPWHMRRLEATPGITGLWQIRGRARVGVGEMVSLDIEYINRQTLWVDLKIMLLTIPALISGRGAA